MRCFLAVGVVWIGCGIGVFAQQSAVRPAAFDSGSANRQVQAPTDVPVADLGGKFRLLGKLNRPLGEVLKVQGLVVSGRGKSHDDGLHVRVFRIGGAATQEFIELKLTDYYGRDEIPNLEAGRAFEMEGYETGGFTGVPTAARKRAGDVEHLAEHRFVHEFVVFEAGEIKLQPFTPADFLGRDALLQGRAASDGGSAYIIGANWKLLVDNGTPWPKSSEGKTVEARGVVRTIGKTSTFRLEHGVKGNPGRLVHLPDQLGRPVSLRGVLSEQNGHLAFRYRGSLVQIENIRDLAPKVDTTGALQLTGTLDQVTITSSDPLTGQTETRPHYVVRKANLKPCEPLLAIERAEPVE